MAASLSGNLASMGPGVPYAIAAKFAHPGRPVFALVGDGAMQMNGLAELLTIAKYRHRWLDQRLCILVLHNNDLNQVTWEQRVMEGDPKYDASQDLPDVDYAAQAELFGLRGLRIERAEDVGRVWEQALAADRPVVIDALVRPRRPAAAAPRHPRAGEGVRERVAGGDSDAVGIAVQSLKQKVQDFLPHRSS